MLRGHEEQWPVSLQQVREGIESLRAAGWAPSFIMMFDEAWLIMHAVTEVMASGAPSSSCTPCSRRARTQGHLRLLRCCCPAATRRNHGGTACAATGNRPNMDMLAWRVDAAAGEAGFSPHRDRQPDNAAASFRADGTPRYATCWLALADATPDTGCLYVVPRGRDPGYTLGAASPSLCSTPLLLWPT